MTDRRKTWSLLKADPTLILALIGTVAYYTIILQPGLNETLLAKYTSEHAVEYVIVLLFFWGIIDIMMKLLTLPREFLATRHEWLPPRVGREPASKAGELLEHVRQSPKWLQKTRAGNRIFTALTFVAEKGSAAEFRDELQHLADMEDQQSHANYTLLRFVIAVTPILGFLGTVVHFGTAIGSFSFDNMDDKLPDIISGMGTAFNTTSVALATAMIMMFAMFLCERVEQSIVAAIDRLADLQLLHRFDVKDANVVPFLSAIQTANREALDSISNTLQAQTKVWTDSLDTLFKYFQERQQQETLRQESVMQAVNQRHQDYQTAREEQMRSIIALFDQRHDEHWTRIASALDRAGMFRQDIGQLIEALNAIARGEGQLVELQSSLAENLRVLHETSQIDSALHGLTAAIHIITSRIRQTGLPDSKAA
jgi:biopolymer transport protein ExbB/TolQ